MKSQRLLVQAGAAFCTPLQLAHDGPQASRLLSASQVEPQPWKPVRHEQLCVWGSHVPGCGQSVLVEQPGLHSEPAQKKPCGQPPAHWVGSSAQVPLLQYWFELQSVPQKPQLRSSVFVSTHEPEQAVRPPEQVSGPVEPPPPPVPPPPPPAPPPVAPAWQMPRLHTWPVRHGVHTLPALPQAVEALPG